MIEAMKTSLVSKKYNFIIPQVLGLLRDKNPEMHASAGRISEPGFLKKRNQIIKTSICVGG